MACSIIAGISNGLNSAFDHHHHFRATIAIMPHVFNKDQLIEKMEEQHENLESALDDIKVYG
jgi:hypothetical protein